MARQFFIRRLEAIRINGQLCRVDFPPNELTERHHMSLSLGMCSSSIDQDLKNPGLQRGTAFKAIDGLKHAHPRLLHHLLGCGSIPHIEVRKSQKGRLITIQELHEGGLFSGT